MVIPEIKILVILSWRASFRAKLFSSLISAVFVSCCFLGTHFFFSLASINCANDFFFFGNYSVNGSVDAGGSGDGRKLVTQFLRSSSWAWGKQQAWDSTTHPPTEATFSTLSRPPTFGSVSITLRLALCSIRPWSFFFPP